MLVIPLLKILYVDIFKHLILLVWICQETDVCANGVIRRREEQLNLLTFGFVSETKGHQRFQGFKNYTYFTYCFEMLCPFG